jgi:hypothetical protein
MGEEAVHLDGPARGRLEVGTDGNGVELMELCCDAGELIGQPGREPRQAKKR